MGSLCLRIHVVSVCFYKGRHDKCDRGLTFVEFTGSCLLTYLF